MDGDRGQAARRVLIGAALLLAAGCPGKPKGAEGPGDEPVAEPDAGLEPREREQLAAIQSAVNAHGPAVHTCWSMAAADDFRVEGQVLLRLTFAEAGSVADVEIEGDEIGDPVLTECLTRVWASSQWPAELFAAGDQIRLPPISFVAPDEGQYVVNARHARHYPLGEDGESGASVLIDYKNSGNSAAAMSLLTLQPGFTMPLHRHTSAEILYVLAGAGELGGVRAQKVERGAAVFVAAGVPHGFRVTSEEPAVLLQLYAPGGPEQRFKGIDVGGTSPVARVGRKDPVAPVKTHGEAPEYPIAAGKGSVSLLFEAENAPSGAASIAGLTLEAGAAVPAHRHASSTELLFILEGGGTMTVAGDSREVGRLDAIQIPAGVEHAFVAGDGAVKAIQFYTPSGPEQRFKP